MYTVKDSEGNVIAICSRVQDAQAMTATVGSETPRVIINSDETLDPKISTTAR